MGVEFVGIELELRGEEGVYNDLQKIDSLLNSFRGKKKVDAGMDTLRRQIVAARGELEQLQRAQTSYQNRVAQAQKKATDATEKMNRSFEKFGSAYKNSNASSFVKKAAADANREFESAKETLTNNSAAIDATKNRLRDLQQVQREVQTSLRSMGETARQTFNRYSSMLTHAGSKMQSFGNALTRLTNPFRQFTSGIVMGAGYKALNQFTEGLEKGFTRYDTMKKYPKIMASFGYSAKESEASIKALDQSVRGLPTGLDEMVDMTQRFTATAGNLQKGTKLAIATNNAFLASMSTDTQKYQGMMQLQDVLGGKDMNAREWNSLVSSMTPAIVKMGESLGYTSKNMSEFIQKVRDGKMSNEDFIDQLIKIGQEGGVLAQMANESKDTWQAFFANVGNAASRMTAGIIQSMDEIVKSLDLKDKDGQPIESVNRLLSDRLIPSIDKATESVKGWIQAHPDEIKDFFTDLSKIDVKSFFKGMAEGMIDVAKFGRGFISVIDKISNIFGGNGLEAFGRFMATGGAVGTGFSVFGGMIKGLSHPLSLLATVLDRLLIGKVGTGLFGRLKGLFGSKKEAQEVMDISGTAKGAVNSLIGVAKLAGTVVIASGTGFVAFKSFRSMAEDFKLTVDAIKDTDWDTGKKALLAMGGFIGAFAVIGGIIGKAGIGLGIEVLAGEAIAGLATIFATGTFAADMKLISSGMKSFASGVKALNSIPDVEGIGDIKSKINNAVEAFNEIKTALSPNRNNPVFGQTKGGLQPLGLGQTKNISAYATAIKNIKQAVTQINQLGTVTVDVSNLETMLAQVRKAFNAVYINMNNLPNMTSAGAQMTSLADSLIQVRRVIYHLNKIGSMEVTSGVGDKIRNAINDVKQAFTDTSVGALASQIQSFATSIKNALTELAALDGEITINASVKLSSGFGKSVNTVIKQIKAGKDKIKKQRKGVNITIPVSVHFSVSTNLGAALGRIRSAASAITRAQRGARTITAHQATGGMIYRAKGGSIPNFKRRGTDTVPAMLTPGEFVQNKRAVNLFGIDFMRKVNSLDMRGAMSALMRRAGSMANVGRQSVVNNTYNNNQRVEIHANNPSPDFTVRSASRFAGAFK